ncbi:hypothetical protein OG497_39625 [Streptomyces sp. NBC_01242]|uniref:hypothetical protein n=1 Tax=Streptomyces sp. NBC_01242 TaxID=2903795 RepID=UPI00225B67FE|nr:hypothetical protein [Streptomyces sp. NBC_01242]MCX4799954.1 hypothetical protein [Streptomyces sp. NBC_01242]
MTTEHTDRVPDLTIPLSTADAQALGGDVGQTAMRLGAVLHGLAQLRAGGASTEDLATTILMSNGLLNRPQCASTPHRAARTARWRAPWTSPGRPRSTAATPC